MSQNHTIDSLRIELDVSDQETAFQLRHQFSGYWHEWVVNYLERAFERLAAENEIIRIDNLEIDLGELNVEDFENDFSQQLQQAIDKSLRSFFTGKNENYLKTDIVGNDADLFAHFLATGQLPWWAASAEDVDLEKLLKTLLDSNPGILKSVIINAICDKQAARRLLYQFDNALIVKLLTGIFAVDDTVLLIEKEMSELLPISSGVVISDQLKNKLTAYLLIRYLKSGTTQKTDNDLFSEDLGLYFVESEIEIIKKLSETVSTEISSLARPESKEISDKSERRSLAVIEEPDKYFIQNAGIILLAPFLPQLFKALEYLVPDGERKGKFKDESTAYRAVLLLGYLASGKTVSPEYTLCLEKILCGLEINEPVPQTITLTAAEKAEATDLLNSIVGYWEVVKTVEGLRTAFFQREGMLYKKDGSWLLIVERKAYDLLLDHKPPPWGFKFLRFSWNTKSIETVW